MEIYLFNINEKLIIYKNLYISIQEVRWDQNCNYFYRSIEYSLEEAEEAFKEFFKYLPYRYQLHLTIKNDSELLGFEITIITNQDFIPIKQTFLVKNYFLFTGSRSIAEVNNNFNDKFYLLVYQRITQMCNFIVQSQLKIIHIYTPFNILWQLYRTRFYKFEVYGLKTNMEVVDIDNYIFKYFLLLRQLYTLKFSFIPKKYEFLITYKYIPTQHEQELMRKEFLLLNLKKSSLNARINKLISNEIPKIFFNNCLAYLKTNFPLCTQNEDIFLKDAFVGGRREIFSNVDRRMKKNEYFYNCDLPSAYFHSLEGLFPVGTHKVQCNPPMTTKIQNLAFYNCKVSCKDMVLPVLPYRTDKILYPEGTFSGTWFGEELNLFLQQGGVIEQIYYVYTWDHWDQPFDSLVSYINTRDNDPKWVLKALKTTFFGSMARKENTYTYYTTDLEGKNNLFYDPSEDDSDNPNLTNYYYASIITSRARIKLYNLCLILFKKKIQICRVNTDSIEFITTKQRFATLQKQYPEHKDFWEKHNMYVDCLYVNNAIIFRKKMWGENFMEQNSKRIFTNTEFYKLREAFHTNKNEYLVCKGLHMRLNTYTSRQWHTNRYRSDSVKIYE